MPSTSQKVGKSLLRYFRPIRIGHPEQETSKKFQLLKFKRGGEEPSTKPIPPLERIQAVAEAEAAAAQVAEALDVRGKEPANWLELVLRILAFCKKTSRKTGQKIGTREYQRVLDGQIRRKIRVVGSIINTDTEEADEIRQEREEASKKAKEKLRKKAYDSGSAA
ncbi:MAG: hypothetical protein HYW49_00450 [Deltaproteobacteria bacterium]|nr:hypothetical protein [Deltaproteobacteria bacterium]